MTMKTKGVLVYLLLAFAPVWAYELGGHLLFGLSLNNPVVQIPVAFAPAIAALLVRQWVTREGFRDAGFAPHLRSRWSYYLVAWCVPVAVTFTVMGFVAILHLTPLHFSVLRALIAGVSLPDGVPLLLLMGLALALVPVFWGEEFGWRGYLQLRLWSHRPLLSAIVTGVIWAIWHYPLFFLGYLSYANLPLGLLSYTTTTVLFAIVLAWLRLRTGSIWPSSLAHSGNNIVFGTLTAVLLKQLDPSVTELLALIPLAALCAWIILGGHLKTAQPIDDSSTVAAPS